eukprot:70464-Rhodomonas_salina.1
MPCPVPALLGAYARPTPCPVLTLLAAYAPLLSAYALSGPDVAYCALLSAYAGCTRSPVLT